MPQFFFVFLIFYCTTIGLHSLPLSATVIWNVGQGSWATQSIMGECHHFDAGGEFKPAAKIRKLCFKKNQQIHISHWDHDHISFLRSFLKFAKTVCLKKPKRLPIKKPRLMSLVRRFSDCPENSQIFPLDSDLGITKRSNDASQIFLSQKFLFPGDSPARLEKIWIHRIPKDQPQILILGHHGSKTSTSDELLEHFSSLKIAVASSRMKKYGHPHPETLRKLRKRKIPILLTEEWGNIWFLN